VPDERKGELMLEAVFDSGPLAGTLRATQPVSPR
jgi:hypothetical protein